MSSETRPCPLGCPSDDEHVLIGRDRIHQMPGEFAVVRCRHCGLLRTNPRPDEHSLADFYPEEYAPYATSVAMTEPPAKHGWLRALARRVFDSRAHSIPTMPPGRLLEFGCAGGGFLLQMRAQGWEVEGVDISVRATSAARAAGLRVHTGTLRTLPFCDSPYDLVVGWMAFEHLSDPLDALRSLAARTRSGGRLAISVPDASVWEFRVFGRRWYALHLPAHLYHFTPQTLRRLLAMGGWEIERVQCQRSLGNLTGSLAHLIEDLGFFRLGRWLLNATARSRRLHFFLLPLSAVLGALGQTGRMTVWARKRDD